MVCPDRGDGRRERRGGERERESCSYVHAAHGWHVVPSVAGHIVHVMSRVIHFGSLAKDWLFSFFFLS